MFNSKTTISRSIPVNFHHSCLWARLLTPNCEAEREDTQLHVGKKFISRWTNWKWRISNEWMQKQHRPLPELIDVTVLTNQEPALLLDRYYSSVKMSNLINPIQNDPLSENKVEVKSLNCYKWVIYHPVTNPHCTDINMYFPIYLILPLSPELKTLNYHLRVKNEHLHSWLINKSC